MISLRNQKYIVIVGWEQNNADHLIIENNLLREVLISLSI